jgi:hypothetical protein
MSRPGRKVATTKRARPARRTNGPDRRAERRWLMGAVVAWICSNCRVVKAAFGSMRLIAPSARTVVAGNSPCIRTPSLPPSQYQLHPPGDAGGDDARRRSFGVH